MEHYISYKSSAIHFIQFGNGDKKLFAFHGFSENGRSFLSLEPSLGRQFTVYAFDIPYHGKTQWNEETHFTPQDLVQIISKFVSEQNIERFSLLGFSMGGKCALHLVTKFAQRIDELWLLASDGIKTNRVYNVAVYPKWGRELFRTTIKKPGWFFSMINILHKMRILSPWLYRFTKNHMDTEEKRRRLYDTWISMAEFNPDINRIKSLINEYHLAVKLIFGKRDEVIRPIVGKGFAEGLANCELRVIDRGHYFIDETTNHIISEMID